MLKAIDEAARLRVVRGGGMLSRGAIRTTTRLARMIYASPLLSPNVRSPNTSISRILTEGSIFIDGGANVGQMSRIGSIAVGRSGEVHSFEPHPFIFPSLINCMRWGGFDNVKCNQLALSDHPGTLTLLMAANKVSSSLSRHFVESLSLATEGEAQVESVTIDMYAKSMRRPPDLIKLDLEGFEYPAILGAKATIDSASPIIICETNPVSPVTDLIQFLLDRGYECRSLGVEPDSIRGPDDYRPGVHLDVIFIHPRSRLKEQALP